MSWSARRLPKVKNNLAADLRTGWRTRHFFHCVKSAKKPSKPLPQCENLRMKLLNPVLGENLGDLHLAELECQRDLNETAVEPCPGENP